MPLHLSPRQFANSYSVAYLATQFSAGRAILAPLGGTLAGVMGDTTRAYELLNDNEDQRREENLAAWAWQGWNIPQGEFHVEWEGGVQFAFQIYTVQRGTLAGQRVIKVQDPSGPGGWKAFAFVTVNDEFLLWSRFARQSSEMFVDAAYALVENLREHTPSYLVRNDITLRGRPSRVGIIHAYKLTGYALRCIRCNGGTDQTSEVQPALCEGCLPDNTVSEETLREVAAEAARREAAEAARLREEAMANERRNIRSRRTGRTGPPPRNPNPLGAFTAVDPRTGNQTPSDRVIVGEGFRVQRYGDPLPLCQVTGTEIQ